MKRTLALAAAAVLLLTGCGASDDARNEVQTAIATELIPDTILASAMDGDEGAHEVIEHMHEVAAQLAADIIDDDMCGSAGYVAGLGGSPELVAAHEQGCLAAARLGLD